MAGLTTRESICVPDAMLEKAGIKVIIDRETRKVIGSQIVSMSEAPAKEIDVMNMAIKMGASPEDLVTINCAGHPELSSEPSMEPISIAGLQASGQI